VNDVKPTLLELQRFQLNKEKRSDDVFDDDDGKSVSGLSSGKDLISELAKLQAEGADGGAGEGVGVKVLPYRQGDLVQASKCIRAG